MEKVRRRKSAPNRKMRFALCDGAEMRWGKCDGWKDCMVGPSWIKKSQIEKVRWEKIRQAESAMRKMRWAESAIGGICDGEICDRAGLRWVEKCDGTIHHIANICDGSNEHNTRKCDLRSTICAISGRLIYKNFIVKFYMECICGV